MRHRRAPTVEHSGNADLGAETLGIGGDRQGGLSRCREQQTVDRGFGEWSAACPVCCRETASVPPWASWHRNATAVPSTIGATDRASPATA